ncbi:helix-turn-helix domain-containing protein [Rubellicoccus peritrichatus]|uniref:Helix-turn-helix domain-containing protein n=1 Tax=Rubellicoccus peritrichatus TaxID=3080537 RepID=A0AAQ3L8A5_9BACT|nr:helix-turn-helix domain-containing protein [Puniceicoccus sp. CR14]WOO41150.1 helix-turn-helix domain-containing protein [Puniceicoccus sp. CR14]
MSQLKRVLNPPSGRRSFKVPTSKQTLPLEYLGWGLRRFGEEPVPLSLNFGWVYAVVLEGKPTLLVKDERVACNPGTAATIGLECPIGWEDIEGAQSKILVWIWDKPPTIERLRPALNGWQRWNLVEQKLDSLDRIHRECRQELAASDDYTADALEGCQRRLDVAWLRSGVGTATTQQFETRYESGLNWMRHNLKSRHPVAELSVYLGVSEATLQRIFKRHTGEGPLVAFQSLKAQEAERLLAEGHSVKSVAWHLGYQHPNDFTRFYKKTFNRAPSGRK